MEFIGKYAFYFSIKITLEIPLQKAASRDVFNGHFEMRLAQKSHNIIICGVENKELSFLKCVLKRVNVFDVIFIFR